MTNPRTALEAILFVAERPIPTGELAEVLELPATDVEAHLLGLAADLDAREAGTCVREVAGGWRLATRPSAYPWVEQYATTPRASRLSGGVTEARWRYRG